MTKKVANKDKDHQSQPCPDCQGSGINVAVSDTDVCATCNGSGAVTE